MAAEPSHNAADPLAALQARIAQARDVEPAPAVETAAADDPLASIDRLIDRARDLDEPVDALGEGPLADLAATIAQAHALGEPAAYERDWDDPLDHLREQMRAEAAAVGAATAPALVRGAAVPARAGRVPTPGSSTDSLEAVLGREVLAVLSARPLSGATRAELARQIAAQLDQPSAEGLRALLELVLSDRPPSA